MEIRTQVRDMQAPGYFVGGRIYTNCEGGVVLGRLNDGGLKKQEPFKFEHAPVARVSNTAKAQVGRQRVVRVRKSPSGVGAPKGKVCETKWQFRHAYTSPTPPSRLDLKGGGERQ